MTGETQKAQDGATPSQDTGDAPPPTETIASRDDYLRSLLASVDTCGRDGVPQIWLCDRDFAGWPLGQPAMIEALTRWAGARRRLTLIAADYGAFAQRHVRWTNWRRQWSHIVQCLAVHEEVAASVPTLLLAPPRVAVRLHDTERYRGRVYREPADLQRCAELVDALTQRADESFPVTTLGL